MPYLNPYAGEAREARTNAGVPVAGTDEVQTLTVNGTPTGGTYRLSFEGQKTAAIAHNASAATIDAALEALSTIGAGGVTAAGAGPYTVTFTAQLGKKNVPMLVLTDNLLTGGTNPTVAITETTPGVDATSRGAPKGAYLTDTTNGKAYINTGTTTAPTWVVIGTQT